MILAVTVTKSGFVQLIHIKEEQPLKEMTQEAAAVEVLEDLFVTRYALSNRQRDVLYLLLKDKTYQEMGNELGLSVGTVKFHAHGIYDKTDSKNRSELISKYRKFYENGRE